MFQPPVFQETRREIMMDVIRAHPFAAIISNTTGILNADHIPLALHGEIGTSLTLRGHISIGNPLFKAGTEPFDVLVVFQGPHAYVSPSWYASKAEHGKVVPTWNYVMVHARGRLQFHRETPWLLEHLTDLTSRHEAERKEPWALTDAPEEYIARQLRGLVGFEITVESLEGKWKLSQNKSEADQAGVREGLRAEPDERSPQVSAIMDGRGPTNAP